MKRDDWTPFSLRVWGFLLLLAAATIAACTSGETDLSGMEPTSHDSSLEPDERPNIIVIVVDDLRWDELGITGHPYIETPNIDRLGLEGARFLNAFHAVPLCSPNRASILTGQYPSRHGIIDNVARNRMSHRLETFPRALQDGGYESAFFGKWHMGNDPTPRPGFDEWTAIPGQGRTVDPELFEDGRIHTVEGYITDILTDRAISFIERPRDRPFFIYIGHKAVHPDAIQLDDGSVDLSRPREFVPAPRHAGRYEGKQFGRRTNFAGSPEDLVSKPALQRALRNKHSEEMLGMFSEEELDPNASEPTIRRRAEMMLAVDESVGRIVETLSRAGILDDTLILFTSDNGYFYGEHALTIERRLPYEESIRAPLLIRYPALTAAGSEIEELVVSIDIAPTVLEVAGLPVGDQIQGRSLVPQLRGMGADWRRVVLIEFFTYENPFPWLVDMDYRAIRTDRYKYIHWMQHPDENELYDLSVDPFEIRNLIDEPRMARVVADLRNEMSVAVVEAMGVSP